MRSASLAVLGLGLVSCAPQEPEPARDPLVLELGGSGPDLRAALPSAASAAEPRPVPQPQPDQAAPPPAPAPAPPPPPAERVVVLEAGMTLYGIARQHLPGRPEEQVRRILARNGWSEAQARRLPEGTKVRLP